MGQGEANKNNRWNKHLSWEERIQIETLQREGYSSGKIATRMGRSERTIRREIQRGWVIHQISRYRVEERYSADRGQAIYEQNMACKGRAPKISTDTTKLLHHYIVVKKYSPAVVEACLRKKDPSQAICFKTIYNHIERGWIPGVSIDSLWEKRLRSKSKKTLQRNRMRSIDPGHSISDRPKESGRGRSLGNRPHCGRTREGKGRATLSDGTSEP